MMRRIQAAIGLILVAVSLPIVVRMHFVSRPEAALPNNSPAARDFTALAQRLSRHDVILFVLRGPDPAAADLAAAIEQQSEFREHLTRVGKDDAKALLSEVLALWPPEKEAELERHFSEQGLADRTRALSGLANVPGGGSLLRAANFDVLGLLPDLFKNLGQSGVEVDATSGYIRKNGAALMFAMPRTGVPVTTLFAEVEVLKKNLETKFPGAVLDATGGPLFAAEYQLRLGQGLWRSGLLSVLLLVLVALALYRDVVAMVAIGLVLSAASLWTLALSQWVLGDLQVLAVSAASILPAVGIDAGVQLYAQLRQARGDFPSRLRQAELAVRRPLLVASLASALGFAAFCTAEVRAFVQFGAMLAIGVIANLLATWLLLPVLFSLAARWGYRLPEAPPPAWLERVGGRIGGMKQPLRLAIIALVVLPLIVFHRPPRFDFRFAALVEPTLLASHGQRAFEDAFGASAQHLFVSTCASDENQALDDERQMLPRLQALPEASDLHIEAMSPLWVTPRTLALAGERAARLQPAKAAASLAEKMDRAGFVTAGFADGFAGLAALQNTSTLKVPHIADFFHSLRTDGGCVITSVFVRQGDALSTAAAIRPVLAPNMTLSGPGIIDAVLSHALKDDLWRLSALSMLGVAIAIGVSGMSLRRKATALIALFTMLGLTWAAVSALGVPITLVTLLVFPFVLGIGIDATIYMLESFEHGTKEALSEHLRPLLGSTLTTLMGFIALMIVDLEMIRDLGFLVACGLLLALFVALFVVPALSAKSET